MKKQIKKNERRAKSSSRKFLPSMPKKKQMMGLIFLVIFGGGLLFWATAASVPGIIPEDPNSVITMTGTPADNFPDVQRPQFCSSGEPGSNQYIREYRIPTDCTQPLAITSDSSGQVWFAQTNTGKVARFDPGTETFTEFENPRWPQGARSMMWGADWSPDNSVWFTDDTNDSVWKFSIDDEQYTRIPYPVTGNSLPQRLLVDGSRIIVNDFLGGKITLLDPAGAKDATSYLSVPTPINGSITSDFAVDESGNMWYTNWAEGRGGVLVGMDIAGYESAAAGAARPPLLAGHVATFTLPVDAATPNGVAAVPGGDVWIADTSSSNFFGFDVTTQEFTRYVTSEAPQSAYGNATGVIRDTPLSRPYWMEVDDAGSVIFNEQTANRIAVFDPIDETLVEYLIPSKNPNWSDCLETEECGLAQALGFTVSGQKVWFTEWVENNIGVLDTTVPLPLTIGLDSQQITVSRGQETVMPITITGGGAAAEGATFVTANTAPRGDLIVDGGQITGAYPQTISATISVSPTATGGDYKMLVGVQSGEVTVSRYVTVTVA